MMPPYLEATMDNFRNNQVNLQEAFKGSMRPEAMAKIAETNMAMFRAAASAFMPKVPGGTAGKGKETDELAEMRAQMEEMKRKLDKMGE